MLFARSTGAILALRLRGTGRSDQQEMPVNRTFDAIETAIGDGYHSTEGLATLLALDIGWYSKRSFN